MEPRAELGQAHVDEYRRLLALLDERRFEEAVQRAHLLLESEDLSPLLSAKCHNLLCWTFAEGLKKPCTEATLHGEEAVRIGRRLADFDLECQALCNLGSAATSMSDYARANAAFQQMLQVLNHHPQALPYGRIIAWINLGHVAAVNGKLRDGLQAFETAESMCRDPECHFFLADIWRRRALVLLRMGQLATAEKLLLQIDEGQLNSGGRSLWFKCWLRTAFCRLELARGNWGKARTMLSGALALARELQDLASLADCCCMLAVIDYCEGRRESWRRARLAINYAIASGRRDVLDEVRGRLKSFLDQERG